MGVSKLDKFKDNENLGCIIQPGKQMYENIKGNWNAIYFKNNNPVVLELACGRGEYAIGMARLFPEKNFVGVDIKGPRIWHGGQLVEEGKLLNVAFLRNYIQNIENSFEEGEVDEIWITFPDPRPKGRDERRRLTHPRFLGIYNRILKSGGWVYFKTDNLSLFEYSLEVLNEEKNVEDLKYTNDLYKSDKEFEHYNIKTSYEMRYLDAGIPINFMKFRLM